MLSQAPTLDALFPAGVARGATNSVTAVGKFDAWPVKAWISGAGVRFTAETNKGRFTVSVQPDAVGGPRLVRLYNDEGVSEPRFFVVGNDCEIMEAEPNNHFAKPQHLTNFPLTINGRLDKNGDVDSYAIDLRAAQWLEARVDAYRLLSKVDAALRLVTTNGEQLTWNHDFTTLDPRLTWFATNDCRVVLQLLGFAFPPDSAIQFTGGPGVVYRLHLIVTNRAPELCGVSTDREPNDTTATAQKLDVPATVHGTISSGADEDRFRFSAVKDQWLQLQVDAASLGSPLDAWMRIEDLAGNPLARADDTDASPDPRLEWRAPTTGTYVIAIGSVPHRGGDDFCYRLSLCELKPDFRATLAANSLVLTPGKTNELKLDLKRLRGFTNELAIAFRDLPPGVTALITNLPAKDESVPLRFAVAENAEKFQGSLRVVITDCTTKQERAACSELVTRGETGFNHLLIETCDPVWLTVRAKEAEPAPAKK